MAKKGWVFCFFRGGLKKVVVMGLKNEILAPTYCVEIDSPT